MCTETIHIMSKSFTNSLARDIKAVYGQTNSIPAELKAFYAAGRDQWNKSLDYVKQNYSRNWQGLSVESYQGPYQNWRNQNIPEYQKFFLALAEHRFGPYGGPSRNIIADAAWIETSDLKRRIDGPINEHLRTRCGNVNDRDVRQTLNFKELPMTIEECLSMNTSDSDQ